MFSIETIIAINEEIAAEAANERRVPFVPHTANLSPPFTFPNIGYHEPDGWEKTETSWFVDKSGFGQEWEPALTWRQFQRELREYIEANPTHGYAITEEGAFQLYVTAFRPAVQAKAA